MKEKLFILTLMLSVVMVSVGQQKLQYRSLNYVGVLEGEDGSSFQGQTIHGVYKKGWFAGLGAGLDYYRFRSVPLFASFAREFGTERFPFYVSADIGTHYVWEKHERTQWNDFEAEYKPSLYWSAGLGYQLRLRKKENAVLLNVGYSFKKVTQEREIQTFCINPPCDPAFETFEYGLRRLSFRMGFQF
jgi:hypothetical protein